MKHFEILSYLHNEIINFNLLKILFLQYSINFIKLKSVIGPISHSYFILMITVDRLQPVTS